MRLSAVLASVRALVLISYARGAVCRVSDKIEIVCVTRVQGANVRGVRAHKTNVSGMCEYHLLHEWARIFFCAVALQMLVLLLRLRLRHSERIT